MINSKGELPAKWMVKVTKENIDILNNYRYKHYCRNNNLQNFKFMACDGSGHNGDWVFIEITFEEFKKYVLNMETRKIIGYKLKKEFVYINVKAWELIHNMRSHRPEDKCNPESINFYTGSSCYLDAVKLGVLDLWFEPVYEQQEEVINMGSFNLTVKPEGIFHKNENIVNFVSCLYHFYTILPNKFEKYDCFIDEISFKKCGCESNKTLLKDWINVWEEYEKIKQ